jgi:hypothetical protein
MRPLRLFPLPESSSFAWQARPKADTRGFDARAPFAEGHALGADLVVQVPSAQIGRMLAGEKADQRAEAMICGTPYPPRMTAAKLPATTARRKAAVMAYSMGKPSKQRAPLPRQKGLTAN